MAHTADGAVRAYLVPFKRATLRLLVHLREVDRRMLYMTKTTRSLFEFVRKELHFSEGETSLRIAAMRLLAEIPELEAKIEVGVLNMTQLNQARNFFSQEEKVGKPLDTEKKQEILKKLEG